MGPLISCLAAHLLESYLSMAKTVAVFWADSIYIVIDILRRTSCWLVQFFIKKNTLYFISTYQAKHTFHLNRLININSDVTLHLYHVFKPFVNSSHDLNTEVQNTC